MENPVIPRALDWAQRLQGIAQSGLNYQPQPFDRLRYEQILALAAEMVATSTHEIEGSPALSPDDLLAIYGAQTGHATPKVDVRGVVFRVGAAGAEVLLVEEMLDGGRWTLPGGWADIGESAGISAAREVWEETGYRVRPIKLLAAYDRHKHGHPPYLFHAYKLFFQCALTQEMREPDPSNIETGAVGWFLREAIADLELSTGRVTSSQIARFFAHWDDATLATDFD